MRYVLYVFLTLWFFFIVFCGVKGEVSSANEISDRYVTFVLVQMVLWLISVLLCIRHHWAKKSDHGDNDMFG